MDNIKRATFQREFQGEIGDGLGDNSFRHSAEDTIVRDLTLKCLTIWGDHDFDHYQTGPQRGIIGVTRVGVSNETANQTYTRTVTLQTTCLNNHPPELLGLLEQHKYTPITKEPKP
ncbi:MAG: hypothetical protein ABIH37_04365 [archaeon]